MRSATGELLVRGVLGKKLSFHEPNLHAGERGLYECGDLDDDEKAHEEAKLLKLLSEPPFSLKHGSILDIDDQSQSLNCQLIISHNEHINPEAHPLGFVVTGSLFAKPTPAAAAGDSGAVGASGADLDDDDFEIIAAPPPAASDGPAGKKRRTQ
ncbi:hypothetical protein T492DRAFT_69936 [Pavlovales sp. CCMP2436]|nr:hypothetical protein T492DRAFT_69936 [Pavlovales sp. CCMP2436]